MVDVVNGYIARKPVENTWQFIVTAAFYCRINELPFFSPMLVSLFMLMLYVKKPDGYNGKNKQGYEMHKQHFFLFKQNA